MNTPLCRICGYEIDPPERARIKSICLDCGDKAARQERKGWCILTPHKQGAMFFTAEHAREAARGINTKYQPV
jgi:hypothetical protein